jgi:hypothetical protein
MPGEAPLPTVREGYIDNNGMWHVSVYFNLNPNEVTHWKPMSEPPKEDAHE